MSLIKQTLYDIMEEHYAILQQIEEAEGEISPDIESQLALTQEHFQQKAISYGYVYKSFDDSEEIINKEIKRLQELKDKAHKRKELFKDRLSDAMQRFGVEKINTPTLSISFRKSESVEIEDENELPLEYLNKKETITPDKKKIKEAIKSGENVPGASISTNQNLQIK